MDFPAVLGILNDVPSTFKRSAPPYTQLMDSLGTGLTRYTWGLDFTFTQAILFQNALGGWLDFWGLLWGVPRNQGEADAVYSVRIERTVLAWVGTPPAIQTWLNFYAFGGTLTENLPNLGYSITLPPSMTPAQVQFFWSSLNRIRPAGMPFSINQISTGVYLGTEEFLGTGTVMGSYLTGETTVLSHWLSASTPNAVPLLPTVYMTDPTINAFAG